MASIHNSPLAGGPVEIHYREFGSGVPLLFLHGGWGYGIYPLNGQAKVLRDLRVLIPDRSGYGRSTKPAIFGADFHSRAAGETLRFLDVLGIERCLYWGHSDGAVIAAMIGINAPDRCHGLVLEAFHYDREKASSRKFFEDMESEPESFGKRVTDIMKREHGDPYWKELLRSEGRTWLDIARSTQNGGRDLFKGGLSKLRVPTVFLHGAQDPRTEAWELAAVRNELPNAEMHVIAAGGHSPHSEAASLGEFNTHLERTLDRWARVADRR